MPSAALPFNRATCELTVPENIQITIRRGREILYATGPTEVVIDPEDKITVDILGPQEAPKASGTWPPDESDLRYRVGSPYRNPVHITRLGDDKGFCGADLGDDSPQTADIVCRACLLVYGGQSPNFAPPMPDGVHLRVMW